MARWGVITLLATLAWAAPAFAQDDCLSGESALADRRALAALRSAIDEQCPCDAEPSPLGRRTFRRCASELLREAIETGTLRLACRSQGRRQFRSVTCGTNRVPCGRYDLDEPVPTCRLAAPSGRNQCQSRKGRVATACVTETHCSDVIDWTAATCLDPREPGPYGVGVRTVRMTKDSVASPGTERVLDTLVYYPTTPGVGPVDATGGVVDAPLDASGGPYPLLLFSHGSCGYPHQSRMFVPLVASHGVIVAAPPHPGNTIFDGVPACQGAIASSAQERPADVIFVTDQLLAATEEPGSPFFGAIDPERIGMSGHSFGGFTTYLVIARDSRFRMALPMAPAVGNQVLTVPSMTMLGQIDSVVNVPNIRAAYALAQPPKFLVEIEDAGHYAFSDACFPSTDCNPPVTLSQPEAHELVQRYALPFVLRYLVGDLSVDPLLSTTVPGVVVSAER